MNQFRRIFNDNGRNDKQFLFQQYKLKEALKRLIHSTNEVVRASQDLRACLLGSANETISNNPPEKLN